MGKRAGGTPCIRQRRAWRGRWGGWRSAGAGQRAAVRQAPPAPCPILNSQRARLEVEGRGGPGEHRLAVLARLDDPFTKCIAVGGGAQAHAPPAQCQGVPGSGAGQHWLVVPRQGPGRPGPRRRSGTCRYTRRVAAGAVGIGAVERTAFFCAPLCRGGGAAPPPARVGEEALVWAGCLAHEPEAVRGAGHGPVGGGGGRSRQGCAARGGVSRYASMAWWARVSRRWPARGCGAASVPRRGAPAPRRTSAGGWGFRLPWASRPNAIGPAARSIGPPQARRRPKRPRDPTCKARQQEDGEVEPHGGLDPSWRSFRAMGEFSRDRHGAPRSGGRGFTSWAQD